MATAEEAETPKSSDGSSFSDDTDSTTPSTSVISSGIFQDEFEKMVRQLAESHIRVANLEANVTSLQQENLRQETKHGFHVQKLEAEVKGLKQQAELDMSEIKRLQNLIDSEMPALQEQLQSVKNVLNDLNVSDTLYSELMARPIESRTVREHILVLAYEKTQKSREEMNALRQERDTSREAMVRANDENQKLRREMQRITSTTTTEKKELELEIAAVVARNERLESELRDAIVRAELLSAKGALYDEVKENLEKLEHSTKEAEKQRMSFETRLKAAMDEKQDLLENIRKKEHSLDILRLDKAYLTRELRSQEDQVKKLESEVESQQAKLQDFEKTRIALYNRVLSDMQDSSIAKEQRIQAEIFRMQEKANEDIDHIRREACESTNRELVVLREMRDASVAELQRVDASLRESRSAYEDLFFKF